MMLVKFLKSTDANDRHYARGDVRELDEKTAQALIEAKDAEAVKSEKKTPVTESDVNSSTLTITNLDGSETVVTATVEPTPVIPLIPTEDPGAFEKRKAVHGAGYSEKAKGSRK